MFFTKLSVFMPRKKTACETGPETQSFLSSTAHGRTEPVVQIPNVGKHGVERFSSTVDHMVAMLAFSTGQQASLGLRRIAADYSSQIRVGRMKLEAQVFSLN